MMYSSKNAGLDFEVRISERCPMEALTKDNVESFKVAELRAFLTERDLPTTGTKSVLVARLKEALELEEDDAEVDILGDAPAQPKAAPAPKPAPAVKKAPAVKTPVAPAKPAAAAAAPISGTAEEEARQRRANRFGMPLVAPTKTPEAGPTKKTAPQPQKRPRDEVAPELVDPVRLAARAKKFGALPPAEVLVADQMKNARAKRFQTPEAASVDKEKLAARAARFGSK
jgi:hypothetical protein